MGNLKETFIKKYGIPEYIVLLAGVAILGRGVYSLIILNLKDTSWEEIAMIVFIFCIGLIACLAPLSLLDFARKRLGMETKREAFAKDDKDKGAVTPKDGF